MSPLEKELETALLRRYETWKQIGYSATYFKRMLTRSDPIYKGPVGTVKHLLGKNLTDQSGFSRLCRAKKVAWTVEALVQETKWHQLFEDWEIARAIDRLRDADSGGRRTAFRDEVEQHSGLIPNTIPG